MTAAAGSPQVRTVPLSDIHDLPVCGRAVSGIMAKKMADVMARSRGGCTDPIRVGRTGGRLYPINDLETVIGMRSAGFREAAVLVTDYNSMAELLAAHVERNLHPHWIDPLKIRLVVEYLMENDGMDVDSACRAVMLDRRPDLRGAACTELEEEARGILLDMIDEIAERIHLAVTPTYYVRCIARIVPSEQAAAARELKATTVACMVSNERSMWPAEFAVKIQLGRYHASGRETPVEDRIAMPDGQMGDLNKKRNNKTRASRPGKKLVERASRYITYDSDLIYVPLKGRQPDLLVNKKTGRVAVAKENGETYTVTDDLGKSTRVLPDYVAQYLGIDDEIDPQSLVLTKYASIERASELLAKARHPGHRCVVITTVPMPKR